MITAGAVCVCACVYVHISNSVPVCLNVCLIEIHWRNLNEIQMRFTANCSSTGNMQIDLMMIQYESVIRPLEDTGWNLYSTFERKVTGV